METTEPPVVEPYSRTAVAIHWLSALLIFGLVGLGWYMVDLPKGPDRGYYFALHKSIGLTVFALLWLRLVWRYRHKPPALPADIPKWQQIMANGVHRLFYVLLFVQPISGYLSSSFSGYKTHWFGVPLPHWGWRDAPLNELFTEIHVAVSIALVVLIGVHVSGAMSHWLEGKSPIIRRMWFW